MIMILDVDVTAEGGIIKLIARRAIHNPRPEGPSPLERSEHNPSTQPAAKPRPLFFIKLAASAATTTLGPKGRQT